MNVKATFSCKVFALILLTSCATYSDSSKAIKLIDGDQGFSNFNILGDTKWDSGNGVIQASHTGEEIGYLVSKHSYNDFVLYVEFWVSDDANSGVFIRCQDPNKITDENCYEANIFDQRPDPSYGTGAIVKVAKVPNNLYKAGGKWNTYEITAKGSRLVLVLNGVKTVDIENSSFASGPIALQLGQGSIKFRKIEIKSL
jgi:hypothetical protein